MGTLAAIAIAVAVLYALACWLRPFRTCRRCGGAKERLTGLLRRSVRPCTACRATGLRLRLGRRAWNYLTRTHERAAR